MAHPANASSFDINARLDKADSDEEKMYSIDLGASTGNNNPDEEYVVPSLSELMDRMKKTHHSINSNDEKDRAINRNCRELFEKDYEIKVVLNDISANYPAEIIIPLALKNETHFMDFDVESYREQVKRCIAARQRSRFIVPAILFQNKFICRSGTTTITLSALHETLNISIPSLNSLYEAIVQPISSAVNLIHKGFQLVKLIMTSSELNELFVKDSEILKFLKVDRICDLMVEKFKLYGPLCVSSSEKVVEEIYKNLKLEEMPYPGCEFFTKYSKHKENTRESMGLVFDWNQKDVERHLNLTEDNLFPDITCEEYRNWNLVQLTQNYLKIMLTYLANGSGGMLVHCISGWDRTPLFISLLRLSLWADGVIHKNVTTEEMAYLTVAYDWFLFGHNFPCRLEKGEEIMHFCFNFLQHITSDGFSIIRISQDLNFEMGVNFPKYVPGRRERLKDISNIVLDVLPVKSYANSAETSTEYSFFKYLYFF